MSNVPCLVCFNMKRRSFNITNTNLQPVYEKITGFMIKTKLHCLCYICYTRLQQCYQLVQLAEQTESLLKNYQDNNCEVNNESDCKESLVELRMESVLNVSVPENIFIKKEIKSQEESCTHNNGLLCDRLNTTYEVLSEYLEEHNVNSEWNNRMCRQNSPEHRSRDNNSKESCEDVPYPYQFLQGEVEMLEVEVEIDRDLIKPMSDSEDDMPDSFYEEMYSSNKLLDFKGDTSIMRIPKETSVTVKKVANINNYPIPTMTKYNCDICPYETYSENTLMNHRLIHATNDFYDSGKLLTCKFCPYVTKRSTCLLLHERTHTGEKPYACDVCNFTCARTNSLLRHKRMHSGEKPYMCDVCDYRSTINSNLLKHKRIHTGEKPYGCDLCGYKSTIKSNLSKHKRTHTSEKPFCCDICNYKCKEKSNLLKHRRKHTEEKM